MLTRLRVLTAGESHGPALTVVVDGLPAGIPYDEELVRDDLARRQRTLGAGPRMRIERDAAVVEGGVIDGKTTGGPIALRIANLDHASWRGRDIAAMTIPRPGHADLTGALKYGHDDLRLSLERASARETAARTAAGACSKMLLRACGIDVGASVLAIGPVECALQPPHDDASARARIGLARDASGVPCADAETAAAMADAIDEAMRARDTLGGVVEVLVVGAPPGLGSYAQWDRRLDARLLFAVGSVPSVKGAVIGDAFAIARLRGTDAHDAIDTDGDVLVRATNRAGGLEGGVTNGSPVVVRAALKPISSTLTPQRSVDLASGARAETRYERSDFCIVPRVLPVLEAMCALVVADALLEKVGGDSLAEVRARVERLPRARLPDVALHGRAWRMYELQDG